MNRAGCIQVETPEFAIRLGPKTIYRQRVKVLMGLGGPVVVDAYGNRYATKEFEPVAFGDYRTSITDNGKKIKMREDTNTPNTSVKLITNKKGRVLSGLRPTGFLHVGHIVGALENWVKLQEDYECFYCIVDWHALTTE